MAPRRILGRSELTQYTDAGEIRSRRYDDTTPWLTAPRTYILHVESSATGRSHSLRNPTESHNFDEIFHHCFYPQTLLPRLSLQQNYYFSQFNHSKYGFLHECDYVSSGVARAPQAPRPRGARGVGGARQGPAGKK